MYCGDAANLGLIFVPDICQTQQLNQLAIVLLVKRKIRFIQQIPQFGSI